MRMTLRFYVYDNASRRSARSLSTTVQTDSLTDFLYGQPVVFSEANADILGKSYILADLPFRSQGSLLNEPSEPTFDLYLADADQWNEFSSRLTTMADTRYGPTL